MHDSHLLDGAVKLCLIAAKVRWSRGRWRIGHFLIQFLAFFRQFSAFFQQFFGLFFAQILLFSDKKHLVKRGFWLYFGPGLAADWRERKLELSRACFRPLSCSLLGSSPPGDFPPYKRSANNNKKQEHIKTPKQTHILLFNKYSALLQCPPTFKIT